MRYSKGEVTVTGNPSVAWVEKMTRMGMSFTVKNGKVIAQLERRRDEKVQIQA